MTTAWKGMRLTFRHLINARNQRRKQSVQTEGYFQEVDGLVTLSYPYEKIPVPDHGRYKLHNEIEDCIVCDKCAKICPVDCIDIEPIKSVGEFGKTSDGTPKRIYAARFDIDMAKCCFCGLCTTVCPTECLTMTADYDFSSFDLTTFNFGFGNISEEEAEAKRKDWEVFQAEKQAVKEANVGLSETLPSTGQKPAPGFRPRMPSPAKPVPASPPALSDATSQEAESIPEEKSATPLPRTRPVMRPTIPNVETPPPTDTPSARPVRPRPMMKPPANPENE